MGLDVRTSTIRMVYNKRVRSFGTGNLGKIKQFSNKESLFLGPGNREKIGQFLIDAIAEFGECCKSFRWFLGGALRAPRGFFGWVAARRQRIFLDELRSAAREFWVGRCAPLKDWWGRRAARGFDGGAAPIGGAKFQDLDSKFQIPRI